MSARAVKKGKELGEVPCLSLLPPPRSQGTHLICVVGSWGGRALLARWVGLRWAGMRGRGSSISARAVKQGMEVGEVPCLSPLPPP